MVKKCAWCGEDFEVKSLFSNDKYCEKHKKYAKQEKTSNRVSRHYKRFKRIKILSQLGTTTLSPHPIPNFQREQEVIRKELNRNKGVRTVYKGRQTYNKGLMVFSQFQTRPEDWQIGTMITHNYASFDDYASQHTKLILNQHIKRCVECRSDFIEKDKKHALVNCGECGLVLLGPPQSGVYYPWRDNDTPTNFKTDDSWMEKKPMSTMHSPYPQIPGQEVRVACKKCHKPYTIMYREKENFRCERCDSRVVSVGMCMPHNFDDEFTPRVGNFEIGYDMRTTEQRDIGE